MMPGGVTFPMKRFPRWMRVIAVVQMLVLAAAGVAYLLTLKEPSWWREVKAADPATIDTASQVENGVVTQLSEVRPADPEAKGSYRSRDWSVSISAADADAWLATRLKQWVENQGGHWPEQLTSVQVEFDPGVIKVGVRQNDGGSARVVYVEAAPELRADGSLWLLPRGVGAGAMPLPMGVVRNEVKEAVINRLPEGSAKRQQAEEAIEVLAGQRPALKDAVVKLEDGRCVRLLKMVVFEGRIELTCRTEKR
jgi:hypothetical protein